jgi:hypothetical protein
MPPLSSVLDFGDVAAWGLIVTTIVFGIGIRHLTMGGAVALAALAGLAAKSVLMPLT